LTVSGGGEGGGRKMKKKEIEEKKSYKLATMFIFEFPRPA